jgi:hypothetical protein
MREKRTLNSVESHEQPQMARSFEEDSAFLIGKVRPI